MYSSMEDLCMHTMSDLNTWKNDEYIDDNMRKAKLLQRIQFRLRERKRLYNESQRKDK
jgi:hypothetical protein